MIYWYKLDYMKIKLFRRNFNDLCNIVNIEAATIYGHNQGPTQ